MQYKMPITSTFNASEKISPVVNVNPFMEAVLYKKKLTVSGLYLTDNDNEQDRMVRKRIIFITLHFQPPANIQTFIGNFATEITTFH